MDENIAAVVKEEENMKYCQILHHLLCIKLDGLMKNLIKQIIKITQGIQNLKK
jgi:hypothetical protein